MIDLGNIEKHDLRPIRDIVFEKIRRAIFSGELKKEDRLVESTIAENLGVSRTPVREALRQLESEGLVENLPRRGAVVVGIALEDAVEIYDIREALEGLMARKTCENIEEESIQELREILKNMEASIDGEDYKSYLALHERYNDILLTNSKNKRLITMLRNIHEYLSSLRSITLYTKDRRAVAYYEHVEIVDALERRNGDLVEILAKNHVSKAKKAFLDSVSQ